MDQHTVFDKFTEYINKHEKEGYGIFLNYLFETQKQVNVYKFISEFDYSNEFNIWIIWDEWNEKEQINYINKYIKYKKSMDEYKKLLDEHIK